VKRIQLGPFITPIPKCQDFNASNSVCIWKFPGEYNELGGPGFQSHDGADLVFLTLKSEKEKNAQGQKGEPDSILMDLRSTHGRQRKPSTGGGDAGELTRVNRIQYSKPRQAGFAVLKSPNFPSILVDWYSS
jgi:hypothetical protein